MHHIFGTSLVYNKTVEQEQKDFSSVRCSVQVVSMFLICLFEFFFFRFFSLSQNAMFNLIESELRGEREDRGESCLPLRSNYNMPL